MSNHELENYLNRLEKSMGNIPISERAEIIMEIKSHVQDASENFPDKTIKDILTSLGEPETVANKYLLERGLEPIKTSKTSVTKWLVIGFLATMAMMIFAGIMLFWKLTPIIDVDEKTGRVQILGGLINVNESKGRLHISKMITNGGETVNEFQASLDLAKEIKNLEINFKNINLIVKNSQNRQLSYTCNISGQGEIDEGHDTLEFNYKESSSGDCTFTIPKDLNLNINSKNGNFEFQQINNNLNLNSKNGKVIFLASKQLKYNYDLSLVNGKIDTFKNSNDKDAIKIKISLKNGLISEQ